MPKQKNKLWKLALFALVSTITGIALVEFSFYTLLRSPSLLPYVPQTTAQNVRRYYYRFDRAIIQLDEKCTVYDPVLTYRLRPGKCPFSNQEFSTTVHINSKGLRDDEHSLKQPDIIFLGDSFTMGWGVEQEETFAQHIEAQTGMKVLNAGVSSFATPRERRLLDELDTSRLKYLVLQYCWNDVVENEKFLESGKVTPSTGKRKFLRLQKRRERRRHYFPGKITYSLFLKWPNKTNARKRNYFDESQKAKEAQTFVEAFLKSGKKPIDAKLILLPLEEYYTLKRQFSVSLEKEIQKSHYPPFISQAKVIDLTTYVDRKDFFTLDGHLNKAGHQKVAHAIVDAFTERPQRSMP